MFTGLTEGMGKIERVEKKGNGALLWISPDFSWKERNLGESVSVNGVCLTVTSWKENTFWVDVSEETLTRSNLGRIKARDVVNLERAMRLADRLGGHLVTGHIDGVGRILMKNDQGDFYKIKISFSKTLRPFIVEKGSIAVDGVSLTVNQVGENDFDLTMIPHTAAQTTLSKKKIGEDVNLETDLVGKYVVQFLSLQKGEGTGPKSKVNESYLREHGFL